CMGRPVQEKTKRPRRTTIPIAKKPMEPVNRPPNLQSELNNLRLTIRKAPGLAKCTCTCNCKEKDCENCCAVCKDKRQTYRYNRLCVYCCRMIRGQNYTRHVKAMHPGGLDTSFVTCLV